MLSAVGDRYVGRNLITNMLSAVGDRYFGRNLITNRLSAVGDRYFETNKVAHGAKSWVNAVGGGPIHYPNHERPKHDEKLVCERSDTCLERKCCKLDVLHGPSEWHRFCGARHGRMRTHSLATLALAAFARTARLAVLALAVLPPLPPL